MSLHSVIWRVHTSSLDDIELIMDGIKWLSGEEALISIDKDKSVHGAIQNMIEAKLNKKKLAIESLERLGIDTLEMISSDLKARIDEDKNMHVRIDLTSLVQQRIKLSFAKNDGIIVKGVFKIESYPGEDPSDVISQLLIKTINRLKK
jgi:RNA binding exosome subunit